MPTPIVKIPEAILKSLKELSEASLSYRFLVACSGGADSVALAHALAHLQLPFALAHMHFGLRGPDADADLRFVQQLAQQLGVPFFSQQVDTHAEAAARGQSTQEAARWLRYQWLAQTAAEHGYAYILTAHHRDDLAETTLLHLVRGKGETVLKTLPARHGNVLRPMLALSRQQLRQWLQDNHWPWREDKSNADDAYHRNFLRLNVLPLLQQLNPRIAEQLTERTATAQRQAIVLHRLLAPLLARWFTATDAEAVFRWQQACTDTDTDTALTAALQALEALGLSPSEAQEAAALCSARPSAQRVFRHWAAWHHAGTLMLHRLPLPPAPAPQPLPLAGALRWPGGILSLEVESQKPAGNALNLPITQALGPLSIRCWQPGDRLQPAGMSGIRKVSDILTDLKVSPARRPYQWVVCAGTQVVYVQGYRAAAQVANGPAEGPWLVLNWQEQPLADYPNGSAS